jgi:mRNA-degrading endonuclease RelE of RelBE toxin-antitoxin system
MRYRIEWDAETAWHLAALDARDAATVLDVVPVQLEHQPNSPTRNRKPMSSNALASWELRIGNLRVYYDVEVDPEAVVTVRAVGIKDRARVFIGGEAINL